jgi:hypothetical protein
MEMNEEYWVEEKGKLRRNKGEKMIRDEKGEKLRWEEEDKRKQRKKGKRGEKQARSRGIRWTGEKSRARICTRLWSTGIDSEESNPPACVAWRPGTTNRVLVPARQDENRFLGSLKGLQIRAQAMGTGEKSKGKY